MTSNYSPEQLERFKTMTDSEIGTEVRTNFEGMRDLAVQNVNVCIDKDKDYGASWKKRGGPGAYMVMARKMDRIEEQARKRAWDIFQVDDGKTTESLDDTIMDLINYLLLIQETRNQVKGIRSMQNPEVVGTSMMYRPPVVGAPYQRIDVPEEGGPTPGYVNQDR